MHGVALDAGEVRAVLRRRQQAQLRQVGAEQPVRVAAHRILGDPERRAEHARLNLVVRAGLAESKHEVPGGAELRRQRREAGEIGLEVLQGLGPAYPDQQPRTARADDAERDPRVEALGGERQRIEHREPLAIVQLASERWRAAPDRDAAVICGAAYFDVDDAGLGLLPLAARRFGVP